ncbi:MAG: hypothetical protein ABIJ12_03730, partial [bacterium]
MKARIKISLWFVFSFALFSFTSMPVPAQNNSDDLIDSVINDNLLDIDESPVFVKIKLEKGQVTAIDTMGYDWYYDFDKDVFVEGYYPDEEPTAEDLIIEEILSVKDRCINEKIVKDYEGDIIVGYDEYVDGDIKAFERVSIKGWVRG